MSLAQERQRANLEILRNMTGLVQKHPDIRFGQWLVILGIVETHGDLTAKDPFYLESSESLECLQKAVERLNLL
ncbi:MAG: hypothetical protein N2318_05210 [Meiothermus sp.]|nr:hypothetical protein [Meiothermus sp.]